MLKAAHRWENDNGSPGIPEIHCTTGVGMRLSCINSTYWLVSLHCRSLVTQQPLCNTAMLEITQQSLAQYLHYELFNSHRLTRGLV